MTYSLALFLVAYAYACTVAFAAMRAEAIDAECGEQLHLEVVA